MKKCTYCGKLNDDLLATCLGCGTALPIEPVHASQRGVPTAAELRARRKAMLDGTIWTFLGLGLVAMSVFYPAWYCGSDPDPRIGPSVIFATIASIAFSVMAVKSFRNAIR
jgi:hypothetical protein